MRDIHATPASRFDQLAAWLIDAAVLGVLLAACLFTARLIVGQPPPPLGTGLGAVMERAWTWRGIVLPGAALLALFSFVYSSLFHALGGRTPGKRVLGLTLVDTTGQPPPLAVSAGRALLSLLSAAPLMLGFLPLFFDRRRQALHDKLTHTFVVRLG